MEGTNTQSLRNAFWEYLSAEGKRGRSAQVMVGQLIRGDLSDLVGPTLVVRSAQITSVEVLEDRVRVTATFTWGDERPASEWTSTWVRYRGRYYLATEADTQPERLR